MRATTEEQQAVKAAVRGASEPFLNQRATPEVVAALRSAVFQALYALAMKRVIPYELSLGVRIEVLPDRVACVQLSDDLRAWLAL